MLELPEIEQYRTALAARIVEKRVTAISFGAASELEVCGKSIEEHAIGKTVLFVERRGKHLNLHLDNGKRLLIKVSNQVKLAIHAEQAEMASNGQVSISFEQITLIIDGVSSDDLQVLSMKEVEEQLAGIGIDPLDKRLTLNRFKKLFAKKRGALKTALADQQLLSGIGQVYADEIAFDSGVRPDLKIPMISDEQWERLYSSMQRVLQESIASGGLNETAAACNDREAVYEGMLRVVERAGQPCVVCGQTIEKLLISSKKTYCCPGCQSEA